MVAFWESFDGSWGLLGSDWVQIGQDGSKLGYWESFLESPGCTLGGLGSSCMPFGGHLVSIWAPWASKVDAGGYQADIAKTIENRWFLMVLGGCRVISGARKSPGAGFWDTGRQKAGWIEGWLGVGWGWLGLAGRLAGHRDPQELRHQGRGW